MKTTISIAVLALALGGCSQPPAGMEEPTLTGQDLLLDEVMAVAYSGYREGQHPDRGDGAEAV